MQKDLFPELEVAFFVDTLYYDFVLITGAFSDDYAIHSLNINQKGTSDSLMMLPVKDVPNTQSFYHQVPITSEMLDQQARIELQVILTDNDLPNGYKPTSSAPFYLQIPDEEYFKSNGSFEFLHKTDIGTRLLPFKVEYVGFGFLLIKKGVFEQIGYPWFEPTYLEIKGCKDFSMEDVTLCLKLGKLNITIHVHPEVVVGHYKQIEMRI